MPLEGETTASRDEAFQQSISMLLRIRIKLQEISATEDISGQTQDSQTHLKQLDDFRGRLLKAYMYLSANKTALDEAKIDEIIHKVATLENDAATSGSIELLERASLIIDEWDRLVSKPPLEPTIAIGTIDNHDPEPEPGTTMVQPVAKSYNGAYMIYTANKDGVALNLKGNVPNTNYFEDPSSPEAVNIYFASIKIGGPPLEQLNLMNEIEKVLRVAQQLYLEAPNKRPEQFRVFYTRLFYLAQLGLEKDATPSVATEVLAIASADLINEEAGRVKNNHLRRLGACALKYTTPFIVIYMISSLLGDSPLEKELQKFNIQLDYLSTFALLWIGCFTGVWLSYGIRKAKFTLVDLVNNDDDRLEPQMRLIFAGLLTMLMGMLLTLKVIDLQVGNISLSDITAHPILAFLFGAVCGISELVLPASIGSRAASIFGSIK